MRACVRRTPRAPRTGSARGLRRRARVGAPGRCGPAASRRTPVRRARRPVCPAAARRCRRPRRRRAARRRGRAGRDAHRARRTSARATRSTEAGIASSRPSGRAASRVVLAHDRLHDPLEDTRLGELLHRGCRSSGERAAKLVVRPAAGRWPPRSRGRHRQARGRRSRRRRPPRGSRPPRSRSPASRPPAPRAACEGGSPRPT